MVILNSKDWSEIVWLPEIFINLAIGFIRKTGMHWLGYNDAVSWLNENSNILAYRQF